MSDALATIFSRSDAFKRKLIDALRNPRLAAEQIVGDANDRARVLNEMTSAAAKEGVDFGPASRSLASKLAESYNPVGMIVSKPAPFNVYHGSKDVFDEFKPGMGVTAKHIYTAPEGYQQDAAKYGNVLYKAEASPKKMIDFSSEGQLDKPTLAALKKAAKDAGITDKYHSFDDFMQNVMDGQLYQAYGNQRTQNALLDELLSRFDAVKMPDATSGGGLSKSVVFGDPNKLKIVERDNQPIIDALRKRKSE